MNFRFEYKTLMYYVCIIFIMSIGLLPITWFKDSLIGGDDPGIPLSAEITTTRHSYVWDSQLAHGELGLFNIKQLPYDIIRLIFDNLGISLIHNEMIFFYFWFTSSGLSMFFLFQYIFKNNHIGSISSALFYMLNPLWFFFKLKWVMSLFSYSITPLLLLFFIKLIKTYEIKNAIYFSIVLSIISLSVNPAYLVVSLISIFIFFIYYLFENNKKIWKCLSILFITSCIFILLNTYWILPMSALLDERYKSIIKETDTMNVITDNSRDTSFLNLFRVMGRYGFDDSYKGEPYYKFAYIYNTGIFIFTGVLISIIVFSSLLLSKRRYETRYILYFSILAILSLFLIKSIHGPFRDINTWLYSEIPGFLIFRHSYDKFGQIFIFSYSFLIGFSISRIYESLKHKLIKMATVIFIFILLYGVYAFPFWTGDVIYSGGKVLPSQYVDIPKYYDDAKNFINGQDEDFKIMSLPFSGRPDWAAYSWKHLYVGQDPQLQMFNKPIFLGNTPSNKIMSSNFSNLLDRDQNIYKFLSLFNIRYLLIHNDTAYKFYDNVKDPDTIKLKLSYQKNIMLKKEFGDIAIYSINSSEHIPQIYIVDKSIIVNNMTSVFDVLSKDSFIPGNYIMFVEDILDKDQIDIIKEKERFDNISNNPYLSFKKINPTKYELYMKNVTKPFFVVFSERFNREWKIYSGKDLDFDCKRLIFYNNINVEECRHEQTFSPSDIHYLFTKSISEKNHFVANGFVNAWYVDPKELDVDNDMTLTIYFRSQSYLYIGIIISIFMFIVCVYCLIRRKIYERK